MIFQVVLEQLTSSPWNNMFFLAYYGLVIEGMILTLDNYGEIQIVILMPNSNKGWMSCVRGIGKINCS